MLPSLASLFELYVMHSTNRHSTLSLLLDRVVLGNKDIMTEELGSSVPHIFHGKTDPKGGPLLLTMSSYVLGQ